MGGQGRVERIGAGGGEWDQLSDGEAKGQDVEEAPSMPGDNRPLRIRIAHGVEKLCESPYAQQGAPVILETKSTYAPLTSPLFVTGNIVAPSKPIDTDGEAVVRKDDNDPPCRPTARGTHFIDICNLKLHSDHVPTRDLCGLTYAALDATCLTYASVGEDISASGGNNLLRKDGLLGRGSEHATKAQDLAAHYGALSVLTGCTGELTILFCPVSVSSLAFRSDPWVLVDTLSSPSASSPNKDASARWHPIQDCSTNEPLPLSTRCGFHFSLGGHFGGRAGVALSSSVNSRNARSGSAFVSADGGLTFLSKWQEVGQENPFRAYEKEISTKANIEIETPNAYVLAAETFAVDIREDTCAKKLQRMWRWWRFRRRCQNRREIFEHVRENSWRLVQERRAAKFAAEAALRGMQGTRFAKQASVQANKMVDTRSAIRDVLGDIVECVDKTLSSIRDAAYVANAASQHATNLAALSALNVHTTNEETNTRDSDFVENAAPPTPLVRLLRDYCRLRPDEIKKIFDAGGDVMTLCETPPSSLPALCEACGLRGAFTKQRVVNGVAKFRCENGSGKHACKEK